MGFTGRYFGGALSLLVLVGVAMAFEYYSNLDLFGKNETCHRHLCYKHLFTFAIVAPIALALLVFSTNACAAADDYSIHHNNDAVRSINSKDYRSAISTLESVLKHEPGYSYAITNLVTAYNCLYEQEPTTEPVQKIIYLLKAFVLNPNNTTTQQNLIKAVANFHETSSNSLRIARDDKEKKRLAELDTNLELCAEYVPDASASSDGSRTLRETFADIYRLRGAERKSLIQKNLSKSELERADRDLKRQQELQLQDLSKGVPPPLVRPPAPLLDSTPASSRHPVFDHGTYLSDCQSKILGKWKQFNKISDSRYAARVILKIDRNGRIVESKLTASSGSADVDQAVLKAAMLAAPFKHLPDYAGEFESFEFSFNGKK